LVITRGRVIEGHDIFDLVIRTGERHVSVTFTSMIGGYYLVARMEEAFKVFDDMVSVSMRRSVIIITC
jgi:pentatricopeptide repeat protein